MTDPASRRVCLLLPLLLALPQAGILLPAGPARADGVDPLPPLPGPRADAAVVEVWGTIYLFGGHACGTCGPSDEILAHDLATGTVSVVGHLPSARAGAAAVYRWPYAYVFGGHGDAGPLADVVRFDPETGQVATMNATMPQPRWGAAVLPDGERLRLVGGLGPDGVLASTLLYDHANDTFVDDGVDLPGPRARMAVADAGWQGFLLGGFDANGTYLDTIVVHAWNGTFTVADARLPHAVAGAAGAWGQGNAFLFGGDTPAGPTDQVVRYDPEADRVVVMSATLPSPRNATAAAYAWVGGADAFYLHGGFGNGTVLDGVLRYHTTPGAPPTLSATAGPSGVTLAWTEPDEGTWADLVGYRVFRGASPDNETHLAWVPGRGTSYVDETAGVGTWYYRVLAYSNAYEGPFSPQASAVVGSAPSAPQNLTATASWGEVALAWDAPADPGSSPVTHYHVHRREAGASNLSRIATVDGNTTTHVDTGLPANVTFLYSVSAENAQLEGPRSQEAEATTPTPRAPSAPWNLTAVPVVAGVVLTWSEPDDLGTAPLGGYAVWRGREPGERWVGWTVPADQTWSNDTIPRGVTYWYEVEAFSDHGTSPPSANVSAEGIYPPGPPIGPTATGGAGFVDLAWSPPEDDGNGAPWSYHVYRRNGTNETPARIATVPATQTTFRDEPLPGNATFHYAVAAENEAGEGALSDEASATTLPVQAPGPARDLDGTSLVGGVRLAWDPPLDNGTHPLGGYRVWRGQSEGERQVLFEVGPEQTWLEDFTAPRHETPWYEVVAWSAAGEAPASNAVQVRGLFVPEAPTGLVATGGVGLVNLSWTPPLDPGNPAISGYRVYRANATGGFSLHQELGDVTSWTDAPLPENATFRYRVSAVNGLGEGNQSAEASATTAARPGAPRDLTAAPGVRLVDLSWAAPASDGGSPVTAYRVHRDGVQVAEVPASQLSYSDTGLANATTYAYQVSAVNAVGEGVWSLPVNATTHGVPTAPRDLVAVKQLAGIRLDWQAPEDDGGTPVTKYLVYRSLSSTSEGSVVAEPTGLTHTDPGCPVGRVCYYRVKAVNAVGTGPASNQAWNVG